MSQPRMQAPQFAAPAPAPGQQPQYQQQAPPQGYGPPPQQQYQQPQPQYQQAPPPQQYQQPQAPPPGYGPPPQQGYGPQYQPPVQPAAVGGPMPAYGQPMNPAAMGLFRGVEHAKAGFNSDYIKPGLYWLRIDKCKIDQNRTRETFWAVEMTVIRVLDNAQGLGHNLGQGACRLVKQANDYFLPEAKAFVAGVMGVPAESVTENQVNEIFGPVQPLTGTVVEVAAFQMVSQKKGTPFTKVTWKREVPPAEVLASLDPGSKELFFPGGVLERIAASEANQRPGAPVGVGAPAPGQQPNGAVGPNGYGQPQYPVQQAPHPQQYQQAPPPQQYQQAPPPQQAPPGYFQQQQQQYQQPR